MFVIKLTTLMLLQVFLIRTVICFAQSKDLVCQIIESNNYVCEKHQVKTSDGYQITLHRIPPKPTVRIGGSSNSTSSNSRQRLPFLLFHGFIGSAADFLLLGRKRSLGCILHEQGFDVWLANARGTTHSKRHINMDSSMPSFWNFTWHEIGYYDLASSVDYVLQATGQSQLHYAAHSQGTTIFFVLLSERPEYNKYFKTAALLAPVAYLNNLQSPVLRLLATKTTKIEALLNHLGLHELFPSTTLNQLGGHLLCGEGVHTQNFCLLGTFLTVGFSAYQIDRQLFPRIFETTPAGISRKQFEHFGQIINSGRFCQYNYHTKNSNYRHYGGKTPPEYKLENVRVPLQLFYGNRDFLVAKQDVMRLTKKLRNAQFSFHEINGFNHIDLIYANEAPRFVYKRILAEMMRIYGKH